MRAQGRDQGDARGQGGGAERAAPQDGQGGEEPEQDREEDEATKEMVERTERRKDFDASNSKVLLSISDLYDTILWSVATGSIGISSSDSSSFDSLDEMFVN